MRSLLIRHHPFLPDDDAHRFREGVGNREANVLIAGDAGGITLNRILRHNVLCRNVQAGSVVFILRNVSKGIAPFITHR